MAKRIFPPDRGTTLDAPLKLDLVFSVASILRGRGYVISKQGDFTNLLMYPLDALEREVLLSCFDDQECRNEIRAYILKGKVPMNETALQIIGHPRFINDEERFTKTFEWYVGEAMVRYFSGFSFAFGVHIKYVRHNQNDRPAGDYDALVVMRNLELLYFECKTGGFKRYKILNAIQNAISLNCDFLVMAAASLDPQRLANTVAEMQHPLLAEHIRFDLAKIQIKNTSTTIYEWHNCYFISASDDFIEQMQAVLRFNEAKRVARHYFMGPSDTEISMMGYQVERIKPEVTP